MRTIDALPHELRRRIAILVLNHSWHDLASLSRTSRTWYTIAVPELYHDLNLKFHDCSSLQEDIAELHEDGLGRHYLRYTRHLDLVCLQARPSLTNKQLQYQWRNTWSAQLSLFKARPAQDSFLQADLTTSDAHALESWLDHYHEENWEPLVAVLARLQHLHEFHFFVRDSFPPALAQTLRRFHPACRINIWTHPFLPVSSLDKRSFFSEGARDFVDILQTSPLHTLNTAYTMSWDPKLKSNGHFPLVFETPNLRHLIMTPESNGYRRPLAQIKQEWQALLATSDIKPPPAAAASLESLTFDDRRADTAMEHMLLSLTTMVDLSQLRSLEIGVYAEPDLLARVAPRLTGLTRLYFNMVPGTTYQRIDMDMDSTRASEGFPNVGDVEGMILAVQAFRPLQYLCLRGLRSFASLARIIAHHGPTLKGLGVEADGTQHEYPDTADGKYPVTVGDHIRMLAPLCPALKELRLALQRTMGNAQECDIYRAIGQSWPSLRIVVLDLDCAPSIGLDRHNQEEREWHQRWDARPQEAQCRHHQSPQQLHQQNQEWIARLVELGVNKATTNAASYAAEVAEDESEDEGYDEMLSDLMPNHECLRELLINAAMDETLVASIFNLMRSHQPTRALRHLRVKLGFTYRYGEWLEKVIRQLSPSFLVSRSDLYPHSDSEVRIQEIGRAAWQLWREMDDYVIPSSCPMPKKLQLILKELWPLDSDRNRSKRWDEMPLLVQSFPLEVGGA
ncbi:hypothetical protein BP00DRAFT_499348 [Aspergillus indologenus CBS 114.80]|uniref:Uncharacterized protein n=1 Tax=Aspergillus indologenus CBS 114.80 TaxID=1450541 RepID=A0A2V5HM97_9EURO|nr:hypothetical protein BP00DRAFT_499348 [Aspergillus indologenus CBS 114.80]